MVNMNEEEENVKFKSDNDCYLSKEQILWGGSDGRGWSEDQNGGHPGVIAVGASTLSVRIC